MTSPFICHRSSLCQYLSLSSSSTTSIKMQSNSPQHSLLFHSETQSFSQIWLLISGIVLGEAISFVVTLLSWSLSKHHGSGLNRTGLSLKVMLILSVCAGIIPGALYGFESQSKRCLLLLSWIYVGQLLIWILYCFAVFITIRQKWSWDDRNLKLIISFCCYITLGSHLASIVVSTKPVNLEPQGSESPSGACQLEDPKKWYFVPFVLQFVSSLVFLLTLHLAKSKSLRSPVSEPTPFVLLTSSVILNLSFFLNFYFNSKDSLKRVETIGLSLSFNFFLASKLVDEHLFASDTPVLSPKPRVEIVKRLSDIFGKSSDGKVSEKRESFGNLVPSHPAFAASDYEGSTRSSGYRSSEVQAPRFTLSRTFSRRNDYGNGLRRIDIFDPLPPPQYIRPTSVSSHPPSRSSPSRWDGGDSSIYSAHKSVQGIPNENEVMRYPPSSSTQHLRRETSRGSASSSRQSLFFPNRSRVNAGAAKSVISVSEYGTDTEEKIQVKERVEDGFGGFVDKIEGGHKGRAMTFPSV